MLPTIDFASIREHAGSQDGGFEELCCQLAHLEPPGPNAEFVRKGRGPDAGVECYWRLFDGGERGWQAKYLFTLKGKTGQLDKSFREALRKHPNLTHYVVCLPFDLPEGRAVSPRTSRPRKSDRDRWNALAEKWRGWAAAKTRKIEIELWDAHAIGGKLKDTRPQYAGKLLYWFGVPILAPALLRQRVEAAIANLGPRYTPELNVELPIAQVLDALCWHDRFRETVYEIRRNLDQARAAMERRILREQDLEPAHASANLARHNASKLGIGLMSLECEPPDPSILERVAHLTRESIETAIELDRTVEGLMGARVEQQPPSEEATRAYHSVIRLRTILDSLASFLGSKGCQASAVRALLVTGAAGMGKSHLIADVASARVGAELPTILVLGQHIQHDPWDQVREALDLPNVPAAYILGALDVAAEAKGSRALLAFDAINEGGGGHVWRDRLAGLLHDTKALPRIAVVLSCRSSFEGRCAPKSIPATDLVRTEHRGFTGRLSQALAAYFDKQGLVRPSAPVLAPEFHNPLFLRTVTKAMKLAGLVALPRGLRGIKQIMAFYGECLDGALSRRFEIPEERHVGVRALQTVAQLMAAAARDWVPRTEVISKLAGIADSRGGELLDLLVAEGALIDDVQHLDEQDERGEDIVRFAYQRFGDHYIAARLLRDHLDPNAPEKSFAPGTPLGNRFHGEALGITLAWQRRWLCRSLGSVVVNSSP